MSVEGINDLLVELTNARKESIQHRLDHAEWTPETLEQQFRHVWVIYKLKERIKQSVPDLDLVFSESKQCYELVSRGPGQGEQEG